MKKSVLLEQRKRAPSILIAVLYLIIGIFNLVKDNTNSVETALGIAMLALSIYFIILSIFGFTATSEYSAKIQVTEKLVKIRTKFLGRLIALNWQEIKDIEISSYNINFRLFKETKSIRYNTSEEQSIQLKQLLRKSAEKHNIQVVGG